MEKSMKKIAVILFVVVCAVMPASQTTPPTEKPAGEPDRIQVQHILISFQGSAGTVPNVTRTQAQALALVNQIMAKIKVGEDFKALIKSQTDDKYPGIYRMANFGVTPITEPPSKKEYLRAKMVKNFGDVGFKLKVGEVGLAVYDPKDSKYGWHIIKRLE
jgi:PPIC-type PPIASE domain